MNETDELFLTFLRELKEDIRQLDGKFDNMQQVLVKNTTVLEEHERRSTASEKRITLLEDKVTDVQQAATRLKGFFVYTGIILTTLGSLAALYHNFLLPYFNKK